MLARSSFRPRKRNAGRPAEKTCHGFAQWVRGRPCYLADKGGCGEVPNRKPVEFAHVDHGGDKGTGTKVSDRFGLPLCPRHHDEQHGKIGSFRQRGGWKTFQIKYGFNAIDVAANYWKAWPGRKAWEDSE